MAEPDLHPVDSTSVARIGYDNATMEIYVEFHTGALYGYRRAPDFVFDAFVEADSKGTFLNKVIKPRFTVRKRRPARSLP
ncbi:MAG TPA: KTSC domain-containing protein [Solirubrobacterales bacterium]|nr:KTSC domain-containing protein [Solirubrobacterales bacterium]